VLVEWQFVLAIDEVPKTVAVSPGSVLDRARDILAEVAPSK
jgi:hypothetical protein